MKQPRAYPLILKIVDARKARRLSQAELARRVGIKQGNLSRIESGQSDIRVGSLVELARVLNFELMLIPKQYVPAVTSMVSGTSKDAATTPAYGLTADDEQQE